MSGDDLKQILIALGKIIKGDVPFSRLKWATKEAIKQKGISVSVTIPFSSGKISQWVQNKFTKRGHDPR
jgi:hypothetical protein